MNQKWLGHRGNPLRESVKLTRRPTCLTQSGASSVSEEELETGHTLTIEGVRLHAENPEAPVIIQPHPESTTDVMIHIMDSARQAGVYNVSLAQN